MRVFVTGGTGLVGRDLVLRLARRGDEVIVLTRDRARAEASGLLGPRVSVVKGDPGFPAVWRESVAGCQAVVNLAGENIFARRWTQEQKARIRESRVAGTRNVVAAIGAAAADARPKVLINASAVGYYGAHGDDRILVEDAHPGHDFLARLCVEWEEAARGATAYGTRVVVLRTGIVLAREGGALARMIPPFRMFLGGPIGSGEQWFSWVHIEDVVGLILRALDDPAVRGPLNATAPGAVRMKEFASALGAALGRPSWLRVPKLALRLRLGEAADVLASGQRVRPSAAERAGYMFRFPALGEALRDLVSAPAPAPSGACAEPRR